MKRRSPAESAAALDRYRALIRRYHGTLDLMSDAGVERLDAHLAEAEAYVEVVARLSPIPERLLDVGSGVGLPGVVLAACLPDLAVELVERRRKRAAFLRMVVAAVGAPRAEVRSGDVTAVRGAPVDVVTAQAVGRLADVYRLTRHRHAASIVLLARKGPDWRSEVEALGAAIGAAPTVLAAAQRPGRGTLLAVRMQGGARCRSSV